MTQTSAIAGSLIVAFIVFITIRGQLPCYLNVLGISNQACGGSGGIQAGQLTGGSNLGLGIGVNSISGASSGGGVPPAIGIGVGGVGIHIGV